MSLNKINPGVYIATIPQDLEECFEHMCEHFTEIWKHSPSGQDGSRLAQESSAGPDGHPGSSSPDSTLPPTHSPKWGQPEGLCGCYACNAWPRRPPPRVGPPPPPARPGPCIPKGHAVITPRVPSENVLPSGPEPGFSQGHIVAIVIPKEYGQAGGPRSGPPPPRPDPCIPKGHTHGLAAPEPSSTPRGTSPQSSVTAEDVPENGSAPISSGSSSSTTDSEVTASSETTAPAPGANPSSGQAEKQSSDAECVLCGDRFKLPGWYEQ
ncbi:hypothetical protein PG987_003142 [Apiospora arundinis]